MIREKQMSIGYQITVTNIITIGIRVMSDFFISFQSQNNGKRWNSPLVHNAISKDNKDYPWTVIVDSSHITVNFHFVQHGKTNDHIIGSTPLLLMKKQGDQQFLIFGCLEQNKGRKIAQVVFQYMQYSVVYSLGSQAVNQKNHQQSINSSDSNKRVSLEYTIQMENNSQVQQNQIDKNNKIQLGSIPQQSEHTIYRQSVLKNQKNDEVSNKNKLQSQLNEKKLSEINPATQTHKKQQANRSMGASIDSIDLNFLKDIEDTSDKWYRLNFGKQKPASGVPIEFDNIQKSGVEVTTYQKEYEYLNDITFRQAHFQLKNVFVNSNKRAKAIQVYGIGKDVSDDRQLIAKVQSSQGSKKEWSAVLRLPKEQNAYQFDVITADSQKLQGLLVKDDDVLKNKMELFDSLGKGVGNITFNIKQVKKVQIQTMELMQELPSSQQIYQQQNIIISKNTQLQKSFLKGSSVSKSHNSNNLENVKSQIGNSSIRNSNTRTEPQRLLNSIYLNRQIDSEDEYTSKNASQHYENSKKDQKNNPLLSQVQMNNKLYLNRQINNQQKRKKYSRKNKFQSVSSSSVIAEAQQPLLQMNIPISSNTLRQNDFVQPNQQSIKAEEDKFENHKESHMSKQTSQYLNTSNEFLQHIKYQKEKTQPSTSSALKNNAQLQRNHALKIRQQQNLIQQPNISFNSTKRKPNLSIKIQQNIHPNQFRSSSGVKDQQSKKQNSPREDEDSKKYDLSQQIQQQERKKDLSRPSVSLQNKIHQIKRISQDISKIAMAFPPKAKNTQYKTVVYDKDKNSTQFKDNIYIRSPSNQSSQQQNSMHKKSYRKPINALAFSEQIFSDQNPKVELNLQKIPEANEQKITQTTKYKILTRKDKTQFNPNSQRSKRKITSPSKNTSLDDQQQIPIRKHAQNSSSINKSNLKQQTYLALPKKLAQQSIKGNLLKIQQPTMRALPKQKLQQGINTERMGIVQNTIESSYAPLNLEEKQSKPKNDKSQKLQKPFMIKDSLEKDDWAKQSLKDQLGSFFDSIMHQQPKNKQVTESIQPTTQKIKHLNFLLTTLSVNYYDTVFGGKLIKIYVPNKFMYQTDVKTKLLAWNCQGFTFHNILQSQNIHIQLCNDSKDKQQVLGTAIIRSTQFKKKKNQTVIRAFLNQQNKITGEVVLSYQSLRKNMLHMKQLSQKRYSTSHDNKTAYRPQISEQLHKNPSYLKKNSSLQKKDRDPVVQFLKMNRKQKISRYMVNQYSRANIESRINPIRIKKYAAGKNIVIGKDIRFPFSLEEEHFQAVPGPGTYQSKSQFKRYRAQKQASQK